MSLEEVTEPECIDFISSLKDKLALSTVRLYAGCVNRFYQFYSSQGTFEKNPMEFALKETNVTPQNDRHRREISLNDMREFIQNTGHPQLRTILVLFSKTGIRAGEMANLDLRDLYIDHSGARRELPEPRPELAGKPDSLFIADSRINKGDVVNGDRRTAGNKRKNATIVPLDDELKQTALYWVAARPPSRSEASPLFLTRGASSNCEIGDRITVPAIHSGIQKRAEERGWYSKGAGVQNNVTPHYFRHWFTTIADRNMDRSVVKYIRGDVGSDIVDSNYRHFWGSEVHKEYSANICKLFLS